MVHKLILMENPMSPAEMAREILPKGFDMIVAKPGTPAFAEAVRDAEFLVGFASANLDAGFYAGAPRLRLLQLLSAGYDRCDIEAARNAAVPICTNGGANGNAVAEHALMLMLAVGKRLIWQHRTVTAGGWRGQSNDQPGLIELRSRTLGIVGLGNIGKKVARLARAFGMSVIYFDQARLTEEAEDALEVRFRLLPEILAASDIVSLHVPLSASTRHLIGAAELAAMKPSAILVNTSRGPVVDEVALHDALAAGRIAGAGLDVFDQEPPAPGNPLFTLDNVVLTPHLAGPTADNVIARFRNAFDNCQRVARGQAPLGVIPELAG